MNKNEQPQQPQGKLSAEEWFNESNFKKSYDVHALDEREIVYMLTKYLEYTEQFNKPTQKTLADLSYVPSQLCPKCHGKGFMQLSGTTSATTNICDVCGGNKIIPMISVQQPRQTFIDEEKVIELLVWVIEKKIIIGSDNLWHSLLAPFETHTTKQLVNNL